LYFQKCRFDVCRDEEGERRKASRRLNMDDLTNKGIEATLEEMEKEMCDLKMKMREFSKMEGVEDKARGQRLRTSDRERGETSGSDREGRSADQGEIRARSMMQMVDNLMGKS